MLKILISAKGWKLREFRLNNSLTIPQFSKELDYDPTLIGMYEKGIKRPDNSFWDKMNSVFMMSPDSFK